MNGHDPQLIQELGVLMLAFLWDWEWVERRVEVVTFPDDVTVRRRVSVDFAVPEDMVSPIPTGPDGLPTFFAPLALLGKQALTNFDLRDEGNNALPLLTREHNGQLARATLVHLAEAIHLDRGSPFGVESPLPTELRRELGLLVTKPADAALVIWNSLEQPKAIGGVPESQSCQNWRKFLTKEDKFMALTQDFAGGFPLIVPVNARPGTRRIVKFSYEAPSYPTRPTSRTRQISRSFGWRPRAERIEVPSMAQGSCFHLEVEAPEGLQITRGKLTSSVPQGPSGKGRVDIVKPGPERVHLHINAPRGAKGSAVINLRARTSTISRAALSTGVLTVLSLLIACFTYKTAQKNVSAAISLLLLVPTALSIYVARPREPVITTGLLLGQRVLAVCCGLVAVLAAALLVIGQNCRSDLLGDRCEPWSALPFLLGSLTLMAFILTAVLAITAYLTGQPPEKV